MKKSMFVWVLTGSFFLLNVFSAGAAGNKEARKTGANGTVVTDMAGRAVTVPANPLRIAPLVGPGYEKIILLGAVDKVAITGNRSAVSSWAAVVAPHYKNKPVSENATDPNIEELISLGVDVVFYWDSYPRVTERLEGAGIPVVVTQLGSGNPQSIDEFIQFQKDEVMLFGTVLGGEHLKKAEEWCAFFEEKVNFVRSRTASLSPAQRPSVYYVRGPDPLTIHGRNSYTMWLVELAGGNLVSRDSKIELLYNTTMEDAVKWDPEYIFMGRVDNTGIIVNDPAWSTVRAVKEGKVIVNPKGVFVWDYSSEGFLLMEFIAKTIHPELFADLDVKQEIKDYYRRFYGYTLTDDETDRIYRFLDPAQ